MTVPATDIFNAYRTVGSKRDAQELAAHLRSPERFRPVVVVSSVRTGLLAAPFIDPDVLAERVGDDADIYLIATPSLSYDFTDVMPEGTSVYGGAARTYPAGTAWVHAAGKAPMQLAHTPQEGRKAVALVAGDVETALAAPAPPARAGSRPAVQEVVDGTVSTLLEPDGALVTLDNGRFARIDTAAFAPGVAPGRLFTVGDTVTGTLRGTVFELIAGVNTPADAVDRIREGDLVPVLVTGEKTVTLFPGLDVRHRSDSKPGTVIAVRVDQVGRADGKAWRVEPADDPHDVQEALPFLTNGEPWIRWEPACEPEPEPIQPDDVFGAWETVRRNLETLVASNEELRGTNEGLRLELQRAQARPAASPVPVAVSGGAELKRTREQVALLTREKMDLLEGHRRAMSDADDLAAANAVLAHENNTLREQLRISNDRAVRARPQKEVEDGSAALFTDPADRFRHDVYVEWATRIPAASKPALPLADYDFADGFLAAVDDIQGIDRSKIVAVAVEVLTGLADKMPGREMHRLRAGAPGAGTVEHPEHGTMWRVSLQVKTAAARRLHFWRGTEGKVVFATVGVHDQDI